MTNQTRTRPDWPREIRARLDGVPVDDPHATAVIQELADHLQDRYTERRAGGATDAEARDAALLELADRDALAALFAEVHRDAPPDPVPVAAPASGRFFGFGDLWRDLRYGARMLRKQPAFTAIAVLTLAFGIGANTTAFTVVNTIFLNPLPVDRPATLVAVHTRDRQDSARSGDLLPISHLNLQDLQAQQAVFEQVTGHSSPLSLTLQYDGAPERVFGELVAPHYFETLGLRPVLGRFFLPDEQRTPGTHAVVVLGHAAWQQRFGGTPDIVGRTLTLNRIVFTVIGVAPEGFKGVNVVFGPDLWMPSMMTEAVVPPQQRTWLRDRAALAFHGIARLKPGVAVAQADAQMATVGDALARAYPDANRGRGLAASPLTRATLMGGSRGTSVMGSAMLMTIVGLVLLIACSNVANLLLARAAARRQEIAVRLALGAGRGRLVRQLLTESVLLGLVSGLLGFALAYGGSRLLWSFRPPEFARNLIDLSLDANVLIFSLVVSVLTGLIFGAAPALRSSRTDLADTLKEEARTAGRSRRRVTLGQALLVGQVAFSVIALVAAGLCLRSIERAYAIDPGFETERLGLLMINPGQAGYDRARTEQFYREVRARATTIGGVTSASWATNLPLWSQPSRRLLVEGEVERDKSSGVPTVSNAIDVDYFTTVGIPLLRGRDFRADDREASVPVAIVNETLAARYWPGQDPLGRRIRFTDDKVERQIVGVVRTANYSALGEAPQPGVYLPLAQSFSDAAILYVRTAGDPTPLLGTVQREVRRIDEQVEMGDVRTIGKVISQALFGATMGVGLLGVFGLIGLGLASLGLYGVMAYSVNLRQREIGLRMALGAQQGSVMRLVLREGMTLVAVGLAVGLAASLLVGRGLSTLLYGVNPADPLSLGTAALVLGVAALLACYLPARRASRLDPLVALREG